MILQASTLSRLVRPKTPRGHSRPKLPPPSPHCPPPTPPILQTSHTPHRPASCPAEAPNSEGPPHRETGRTVPRCAQGGGWPPRSSSQEHTSRSGYSAGRWYSPSNSFLAPAGRLGPRSGAGGLGWALQVTGQPEPGHAPCRCVPGRWFTPQPWPRAQSLLQEVERMWSGEGRARTGPADSGVGTGGGGVRPQNGSEHQTDAPGLIYGCSLESCGVCVSVSECEVCVCVRCVHACVGAHACARVPVWRCGSESLGAGV